MKKDNRLKRIINNLFDLRSWPINANGFEDGENLLHSNKLASDVECHIDRNDKNYPDMAVLKTYGGRVLLAVPAAEWADHQIFTALEFANQSFQLGLRAGKTQKINEIKRVLADN